jgi:tetratricopeptide (TPR) repeat protein
MTTAPHLIYCVVFLTCLCEIGVAQADSIGPATELEDGQQPGMVSDRLAKFSGPTNAHEFLETGFSYYRAKDFKQAVAALNKAVSLEPTNYDANLWLGYSYYYLGKYGEATIPLRSATQCEPTAAEAHYWLAETLYILKRYDEAAESFRNSLAIATNQPDAWLALGHCQFGNGDYQSAAKSYKQCSLLSSTNYEASLWLGVSYYYLGEYGDATSSLRSAIQVAPNEPEAHYWLGETFYILKRFDVAAEGFRKSLSIATNQPDAWLALGHCQFGKREYQGAAESYRNCLLLSPTNYLAHLWLAHSLVQLDRPDQAAVAFGEAARLRPYGFDANLGRGMTLLRLSRFVEAIPSLERAMESRPRDLFARWGLFVSYLATGQMEKIVQLHLGMAVTFSVLLLAGYLGTGFWLFRKSMLQNSASAPGLGFSLGWCSVTLFGQTAVIILLSLTGSLPMSGTFGWGLCLSSIPLFAAVLLGFRRQLWGEPFAWPPRMPNAKLLLVALAVLGCYLMLERGYVWFVEQISGKPIPEQLIVSWLKSGTPNGRWITFVAVAFVGPAVEEILFRGLLFGAIENWLSSSWTIVLTAMVFSLIHLQAIYFAPIFVIGLVLGWARHKSGGLTLPFLLHSITNCAALLFLMH